MRINRMKLFLVVCAFCLMGQSLTATEIRGRVTDHDSGEPLAFVHIVVQGTQRGTMTDMDGFFSLQVPRDANAIQLSYVGYFPLVYEVLKTKDYHHIRMHPQPMELQEVVVYAGENPAHRIIRNAMSQRRSNDPERLNSFSYTSYNKFLATLDQDFYWEQWEATQDSAFYRMIDLLEKQHIFIMESVAERRFMAPNRNNEIIVANRVSGIENPSFTMLATELQSFSFYGNYIRLMDREFVSPLNRAAFGRYFYHLEDTLYQQTDTVFVVGFRPMPQTHFDGLKGVLYIHTHNWAVQNVIAQPAHKIMGSMDFKIQQKYVLVDGEHWFPQQLHTDIDFFNPAVNDPTAMPPVRMLGRTHLKDIEINPPLRTRNFSTFTLEYDPGAHDRDQVFWEEYQAERLSLREQNTYVFMDSVGREINLDRLVSGMESLAFGDIPWGFVNIPLQSIYRYNAHEKHRLGVGLETNRKFSQRLAVGGHYAWGTGDSQHKYGYFGELVLHKNSDLRVGGSYSFDVKERGSPSFMNVGFVFNPNQIRNLYIEKMDYTRRANAYVSFRAMRNFLMAELSVSRGKTHWGDGYYFVPADGQDSLQHFRFTEAALRLRFAYGETLINMPSRVVRMPASYPVLSLNLVKGFDHIDQGQYDYLKLEANLEFSYPLALLGRQNWMLEAGWSNQKELPWPLLFTARSANRRALIAAPFSFGTMKPNEFFADQYFAVFFQHNFGSLLWRSDFYQPQWMVITNVGVGKMKNHRQHSYPYVQPWHKPYYESGLVINQILPRSWSRRIIFGFSPGLEVLYRYGPYALPESMDNFTFKMNMITSF